MQCADTCMQAYAREHCTIVHVSLCKCFNCILSIFFLYVHIFHLQSVDVTCICPRPVKRRGKYMFCRLLWIFCKRSKCTKLPMVPYKNKELNIDKDFANLQNMQNHSFSPCSVAYIAKHKASRHNHICWMLSHAACLIRLLPNYYFYSQLCVFKKISYCSGAHFTL